MMTINVTLSKESIQNAIRQLEQVKKNIRDGVEDLVDMLCQHGGQVAQAAYGHMASAEGHGEGFTGTITAYGEDVIIAEFGAGFDTMMDHPMAANAPVNVAVGEYSRQNHGQFWQMLITNAENPHWRFGGRDYDRVPARHGLLDAEEYIIEHAPEYGAECIRLNR